MAFAIIVDFLRLLNIRFLDSVKILVMTEQVKTINWCCYSNFSFAESADADILGPRRMENLVITGLYSHFDVVLEL